MKVFQEKTEENETNFLITAKAELFTECQV